MQEPKCVALQKKLGAIRPVSLLGIASGQKGQRDLGGEEPPFTTRRYSGLSRITETGGGRGEAVQRG